jgi:hypothetical protein
MSRIENTGSVEPNITGQSDNLDLRIGTPQFADCLYPILLRHEDIGDHQIWRVCIKHSEAGKPVIRFADSVPDALQNGTDNCSRDRFIVYDKHAGHLRWAIQRVLGSRVSFNIFPLSD